MNQRLLIILILIFVASIAVKAQTAKQSPNPNKKTAIFKIPDGFLPAKFPPDRIGLSMLNPNGPAGMFLAYTPDNQKSEDFIIELRKMYAGYFGDTKEADLEWREVNLPAHEGIADETGKMFLATNKGTEIQVVTYIRTISEGQDIVYGYFATRDVKSKKNSTAFIDEQGKGVKEFEKFWKTVGVQK